jgi:hypothetical protein
MADQEMIQEKIGEALGLEKAAQKAVEDLDSRGLLKPEQMKKLSKMKEEARSAILGIKKVSFSIDCLFQLMCHSSIFYHILHK